MHRWIERVWYGGARGGLLLVPASWLFAAIVAMRRRAFARGWLRSVHPGPPVVVVGNLSVGGAGKTPLTAWLATALAARGLRVGIVSRGYGGRATGPTRVDPASDPTEVGDEPVLLSRRTGVPVVVARDRVAGAGMLAPAVDLILADDGLQHYRLRRDFEIAVVDGGRRYGNGRLLPAGPLREPVSRAVDAIIVNGAVARRGEIAMTLEAGDVVALGSGTREPLAAWAGRTVHAVAGIGHPGRFFATLRAAGLVVIEHPLPDHAMILPGDVAFGDGLPVLMTEKDAVKCAGIAAANLAYLEVAARIAPADAAALLDRIAALADRR